MGGTVVARCNERDKVAREVQSVLQEVQTVLLQHRDAMRREEERHTLAARSSQLDIMLLCKERETLRMYLDDKKRKHSSEIAAVRAEFEAQIKALDYRLSAVLDQARKSNAQRSSATYTYRMT